MDLRVEKLYEERHYCIVSSVTIHTRHCMKFFYFMTKVLFIPSGLLTVCTKPTDGPLPAQLTVELAVSLF